MSAAASAAAPALRDYAAIGDGRTVALIGLDGSVDWFPLPDLDSVPVFAHLLDAEGGGRIELAPAGAFTVRRRYVRGTNVLETTFRTASGSVKVTDALVTGVAGRLPWAELARRIEAIDGEVRMRWAVRPGTGLGTASPWIQKVNGASIIRDGGVTIGVTGREHHPRRTRSREAGDDALRGGFTATAGSRHMLIVVATDSEPLHIPNEAKVEEGIERTIGNWRTWSREFSYDGPWAPAVHRSALALKLLVYAPSGAVAAAATTSLPESPEGGKNWDYRFAWVRDAAYSVRALVRFGLREETHAAFSWLLRTIKKNGPRLHVFYNLDGTTPEGVIEYAVPGWNGIGPVVSGNPAQHQLQLGVFGDLLALARSYVDQGNILDVETGRMLADVADRTCDLWRNPDSGMWELATPRHFTSSKMGCWQALDSAVALGEAGQIAGSVDRWRSERDRIREWVEEHCWDEQRATYVMAADSDDLDASVLLHAPSGFDRGPRMASTIDALVAELGRGTLLYRYSGMPDSEHPFAACSFWLASALACVGRKEEAVALMDDLVTLGNDVGLYPEMIAEDRETFWGNLPQALTHLSLISAAITIEELTR